VEEASAGHDGRARGEGLTAHLLARFFLEGGVARPNKGEGIRKQPLGIYIVVLGDCMLVAAAYRRIHSIHINIFKR
jgi:hypothetical protein